MTTYVVDSMAYLRYLVDRLPEQARTIFDRAEAGVDTIYAPDVVVGETLYQIAFGDEIAGVGIRGNPNEVYRRTVRDGPINIVSLDEHAMAIYANLVEFYEQVLHDAMVHAAHRILDSAAIISDDTHLRQNDVELVWS